MIINEIFKNKIIDTTLNSKMNSIIMIINVQ